MPRELTEAEWKVSFGSDSIPDYARAAISAADAYGWMDEQTQRTIAAFQRAASVDVTGLYDYDTAVRAAAFGKTVAPRAFTFGAEVDIASLQAKLNALGYQPALAVDGAIGDKTRAGVRWFQAAHSLSATGVLDNATVMALDLPKGPTPKKPIAQVSGPPVSGLRQVVVNSFLGFSTPFEGYTPYLYTDSKGFVTTGMGNLVENLTSHTPIEGVFSLVWKKPDGSAASRAEIAAAWQTVKSAWPGVQSMASQRLTNLRLPQEEIAKLIAGQLSQNQTVLQKKFPGFSSWPADAQLAFHSLSWAWGPGFIDTWRNKISAALAAQFENAVNASPPDFRRAADIMMQASSHEESINRGIVPRDKAGVLLLQNAADVLEKGGNPDALYYPNLFEAGVKAMLAVERAIPMWAKVLAFLATTAGLGFLAVSLMRERS